MRLSRGKLFYGRLRKSVVGKLLMECHTLEINDRQNEHRQCVTNGVMNEKVEI